MPPDPALQNDDDYVVSLLLKDAESNRKRYLSNSGLGSLLSRRPRGNAPKPNTRFLKNIIRETDSHNAALKAKEEEESKARLREMREGKRKREWDDEGGVSKRRRGEDRPRRWASALGGVVNGYERREGRGEKSYTGDGERSRHRDRRDRERSRERNNSRRHDRQRKDEFEDSRSRSRSPTHRKQHKRRERSRTPPNRNTKPSPTLDSDSDPLDAFLGPQPPPTTLPRGRGAHKINSSSMDTRFAPSYNPKTDVDVSPDEADGDDWDMALEALRDRAKWRAQGAERLREAGFTEEEVERWEKSAAFPNGGERWEKDVMDVRWRRQGEGREWDRGKVVGEAGVEARPEWGRLKGS
jgi:hypothetical protein